MPWHYNGFETLITVYVIYLIFTSVAMTWKGRNGTGIVVATMATTWWRHQMETFSALLAICAGNSSVIGEFPAQRPVTRSFDVFFHLCLNKRLSKQAWGWWFETRSRSLWRHCNEAKCPHRPLLEFESLSLVILASCLRMGPEFDMPI